MKTKTTERMRRRRSSSKCSRKDICAAEPRLVAVAPFVVQKGRSHL